MTEPQDVLAEIEARDADWADVGDPGTTDPRPLHLSRHEGATHISGACAADAVRDRRYLLALVRTPETLDVGTTTDCSLAGVHEHPFRGPHRFHEWDPADYASPTPPEGEPERV